MTDGAGLDEILAGWELPGAGGLLDRVEEMIRPALLAGHFGSSFTRLVSGLQYHLGGATDTAELARLARLQPSDRVLDVCCFIGGPAVQLASSVGCHVTGIDLDPRVIAAARRIAAVTDLADRLRFEVGDAGDLPIADRSVTVVWNQCSLESDERWLQEMDRVLAPGGRFAVTFQRQGQHDGRWTLQELTARLERLRYTIDHADDITGRDIEIGWRALDRTLSEREEVYRQALGPDWVHRARREFRKEIEEMQAGAYGNARVVATKATGT